ncbi:DUF6291 domain-containing protein [Lachnospiraceae bacterium 48-33]
MRDGIVFYKSFFESISELPEENALNIYNAIFKYAFFDEEPELLGIEKAIFTIIKPQIDANNKKYENGKKGGRPPKKVMDKEIENNRLSEEKTTGFKNEKPKGKGKAKAKAKEESKNIKANANSKDTYCTEPETSASVPAVIELPLNDKSLYPITQQDINGWIEIYPSVDVMQELRKMRGWLDANPTKRKTSRGIRRFVNSWLSRSQDEGGVKIGKKNNEIESTSSVKLW